MAKQVVIIGGGIVGLATALQLQKKNAELKITILEKESRVANHQTGNNSGVIHSGIYYKPGSLKAKNCKLGYELMLDFCKQNNIPFDLCGKLIVATSQAEISRLDAIMERGIENGLEGLRMIGPEEIKEIEPHTAGLKAIVVPQTGIVSYRKVSEKMEELFIQNGGTILFKHKVLSVHKTAGILHIETEQRTIEADIAVNCAGLYSDKIFKSENPGELDVKIIPFRGEYFKLKEHKRYLVKHLIYPVPDPAFPFLGVHFTRRIDGEIEAGPNAVLAFRREGYKKTDFNLPEFFESISWPGFVKVAFKYWKTGFGEMYRSWSKAAFTKALQKLLPEITEDDLEIGGAGVRAQACMKDGSLIDDFLIRETSQMVHVLNAPSPAATSSLAIGNTVSDIVLNKLKS